MKRTLRLFSEFVSLVGVLLLSPLTATASGTPPELSTPQHLSIAEVKMTGDEFVVLQNNGSDVITDLSTYWLYSFNRTNPQTAGATSSAQQLPIASLDPGQSVLLSSGGATCGAAVTAKLSVSLADSTGALQLLGSNKTSGLLDSTPVDAVSWGAGGDIAGVPSSTKDKQAVYYRTQLSASPPSYGWQLADVHVDAQTGTTQICQLDVATDTGTAPVQNTGTGQLLLPGTPPATIVSVDGTYDDGGGPNLPAQDIGLQAPQINELLPNPIGTGNDTTDEFIELYNANPVSFDLSGFILQAGTTTKHKYTFEQGTMLPPKSFTAFYSATTGLSLSNSGGQAALLDPFGNVISQSDIYGSAKDGITWALAKGTWYWTGTATPGAANVITATTTSKSSSKSGSSGSAVKGASTTKGGALGSAQSTTGVTAQVTPIHPWTLAIVAVLAVAYGVYEYRLDIQNRLYELRRHRAAR